MSNYTHSGLEEPPISNRYGSIVRVLKAGLVAGTLDFVFAMTLWASQGVPITAIPKSVASELMGPDAFAGGTEIVALGTSLHLGLTIAMAATYAAAAPAALASRPYLAGPLYGALVWLAMNKIVVPLSAAPVKPPPVGIAAIDLLGHVLLVGLPIALMLRPRRRD